jgi:hypothetical protein
MSEGNPQDNGKPTFDPATPQDARFIAGMAEKVMETLDLMNLTTEMKQSIITTLFVNYSKKIVRESAPETFEDDKKTIVELLIVVARDIDKFKPPLPGMRST